MDLAWKTDQEDLIENRQRFLAWWVTAALLWKFSLAFERFSIAAESDVFGPSLEDETYSDMQHLVRYVMNISNFKNRPVRLKLLRSYRATIISDD